jgi:putative ABC transport system substrate-binding protein
MLPANFDAAVKVGVGKRKGPELLRMRALETAKSRQVEAGILLSSPLVFLASEQVGKLAVANQLPLISLFGEFPKRGGLIAYGPNVPVMWQKAGAYVGKILHGAKPNDLPIQRPEKFDLAINLKTATAIGVDVPAHLQQLADEIIEWGACRLVAHNGHPVDATDVRFGG